jgi:gamma-D-glutamyl-L-lysine dipeptidyl-peptidase
MFAVCQLSVVPVRANPSDAEEMVTQLLFGELVEILEAGKAKKNWCKIRCDYDGYEGWMDIRQLRRVGEMDAEMYRQNHAFCLDLTAVLTNNNHFLPITMGAILPMYDGINLQIGDKHYAFNGQGVQNKAVTATPELVIKFARRYLYAPYLWGGKSPFGIDCSGFTQVVFRMTGVRLRRDASQQAEQGRLVDFVDQTQMGDLAFFENDKGKIIHVGIVMEGNQIIHAAGQVRIDRLDHQGIYNEERRLYSHKLRIIKRFLPDMPPKGDPSVSEPILEVEANQISIF